MQLITKSLYLHLIILINTKDFINFKPQTMSGKLQISIVREANGDNCELDSMSLSAAKSFIKILDAVTKFVEAEQNKDIKIKVKKGSAMLEVAPPSNDIMSGIQNNINDVLNRESSNAAYLVGLREIQNVVKANGLVYDCNIFYDNVKIDLIQTLKEIPEIRAPRRTSNSDFLDIEFFKGRLLETGGVKPNFHIEVQHAKVKIICNTEQEARTVRNDLYKTVHVSAWVTMNPDNRKVYTFIEYFEDNQEYMIFKSFIRKIINEETEAALELIYSKFHEFMLVNDTTKAESMIKHLVHSRMDANILRTVLILMKGLKENPKYSQYYENAEKYLSRKTKKQIL